MPSPIKGKFYLTQKYGLSDFARSPAGKKAYKAWGGLHYGLDFGTKGQPLEVTSLVSGKVVRASMDGGWGNHVEVEGADGWRSQYAHLSAITCKVGDVVAVGDVLGRVGTTGASTGVHLHLGSRRSRLLGGWEYRDPSVDLQDKKIPVPKKIKGRLIKANDDHQPNIYAYNGVTKFRVPDMETLRFLFPKETHELVDEDIISKIPEGAVMISMK